jgi:lipopolysaccharide transport system permease protein
VTVVDTRAEADVAAAPDPLPSAVPPLGPTDRTDELPPEHTRTIPEDLGDIWRGIRSNRDLIQQLTLRDIRVRYKQAALGFAWALLMPTVVVIAGMLVRAAIAYAAGKTLNMHQIASIGVKSVPWAFFLGCINMSLPSLLSNKPLVTKIYFPREILPLSAVLAQTFDSAIGGVIVSLILPFFGIGASLQLLWVPFLLVLLWMLSMGLGLMLSCANLFFRDVKYLVQVYVTFGIFITPVLLDASMYGPRLGPILMLNPISPILEGLRLAVVEHHNLLEPFVASKGFTVWHPWYVAYMIAASVLGLLGSALIFHRLEERFAETV